MENHNTRMETNIQDIARRVLTLEQNEVGPRRDPMSSTASTTSSANFRPTGALEEEKPMTLVVGTFPRNPEGAEMVRYVANTIRPMFVKTGALWGEIKAPYVTGSVVHVDMRHTDMGDVGQVLKEFYALQKEGKLEIGGTRYWVAQERTRSQAMRA